MEIKKRIIILPVYVIILLCLLPIILSADETTPNGVAQIYIYRAPSLFGILFPVHIIINQKTYAILNSKTYTMVECEEGDLLVISSFVAFSFSTIPNDAIKLKVQTENIYYLKTYPAMSGMVIEQVDEETGRKDIVSGKYGKVTPEN
jgi:hypothetical protein